MEAITLHPPTQDEIVAEQRWKEKQARQKQGEQEQEQEQEQEKEKEQDHEQEQKQEQELEQQQGLKGKLGGVLEQGKRQGWKLRSIWSIRDPLDYERAVLLRPHRPPVEAQPAQGWCVRRMLRLFPRLRFRRSLEATLSCELIHLGIATTSTAALAPSPLAYPGGCPPIHCQSIHLGIDTTSRGISSNPLPKQSTSHHRPFISTKPNPTQVL